MTTTEILGRLVLSTHVPMRDFVFNGAEPKFITYFDVNGNEVSMEEVEKVSAAGKLGEVDYFTPTPGVGYYAHLRLAGSGTSAHGGSTRYEIAATDWMTMAHVTEPAAGGEPDIVVDEFEATRGADVFAAGIASRL
jgi:hypothetical protein